MVVVTVLVNLTKSRRHGPNKDSANPVRMPTTGGGHASFMVILRVEDPSLPSNLDRPNDQNCIYNERVCRKTYRVRSLKKGGYIVYIRHGSTRESGEKKKISNCQYSQRILTTPFFLIKK